MYDYVTCDYVFLKQGRFPAVVCLMYGFVSGVKLPVIERVQHLYLFIFLSNWLCDVSFMAFILERLSSHLTQLSGI